MAAVCYSGPLTVVPINGQLLEAKKACKISDLFLKNLGTSTRLYRQTDMPKSKQRVMLIIYICSYIYICVYVY